MQVLSATRNNFNLMCTEVTTKVIKATMNLLSALLLLFFFVFSKTVLYLPLSYFSLFNKIQFLKNIIFPVNCSH